MVDTLARKYITLGSLDHFAETYTSAVLNDALNTYAAAFGHTLSLSGYTLSLNNSTGETLNSVTLPSTVSWSSVTDKPASFTPATHTHAISDTTGLSDRLEDLEYNVATYSQIDAIFA